jgi:hypothetical protein
VRISVWESAELQALLLALRGFDRALKKEIRQRTKAIAQPEWQKAVAERAERVTEQRVLAQTARVQVSDQNVTLRSAAIGRGLSHGLKPQQGYGGIEFGGNPDATSTYTATSSKGKSFSVTRRTRRHLRPRKKSGYVVFPAAAQMIPRLASLWAQTAVRTFHETIERATNG